MAFIFTISLLCMGQIIPPEKKSKYSLTFPFETFLKCDSYGNSSINVTIETDSKEKTFINNLRLNNEQYCVEHNNIMVTEKDTLNLSKKKPLELKVYQIGEELERTPSFLEFSSSNPDFKKNRIRLHSNTVQIDSEKMRTGKIELEVSKFSADSVLIRFPYGGTISSATIWKNSDRKKEDIIADILGYEFGSNENYIVWPRKNLGKFSVFFGSCHWSADFQLILK